MWIVLKLGGSLLDDLPDAGRRVETVARDVRGTGARPVIVAGGGAAGDAVRTWDRVHGLGQERSHWLAVRALGLTARLAEAVLSTVRVVTDEAGASEAERSGATAVLDPWEFLSADERSVDPLPHHWDVTTDSIAARVARRWGGALRLLKSVDLPAGTTWEGAAATGLVDRWFPREAAALPEVRWINLRTVGM